MKKVLLKQLSLLCFIIALAAIYKPLRAQQGNDSIGMGWYYEMYQSGGNFLDIKNRAEQFFATHPDYDTVAELKNQYLDWLRFNRDRAHWVDSAAAPGDLNSANKAMSIILSEKSYSNQTPYESDWKFRSVDEWNTQNLGIITCIWQDPNNSNRILAGTEASGLWRSTNGGNTWVNITDSYFANDIPNTTPERIPLGFGVSSIAVTIVNNLDFIIISTYLPKTTSISSYAVGLIGTLDYGQTWIKVTHPNIPSYNSDLIPAKLNCFKVICKSYVLE